MVEKVLTIGIPIYNMEKLLSRCLDSVVASKYIDKLDIIAVNDGSVDKSLEIAQGYQQRYPNSVRVIDKPNGGWGTAINKSIELAEGKYYKSLDSDDWFNTSELDEFIPLLEQIDCDMVITDFNEVNERGDIRVMPAHGIADKPMLLEEYLKTTNMHGRPIHAITFRTAFLQEIQFEVMPKYYADLDYILTPQLSINEVCVLHLNIYQYFCGRAGQSVSVEGYNKHFQDYINVTLKLLNVSAMAKDKSPYLYQFYINNIYGMIVFCYRLLMMNKYQRQNPESKKILKDFDKTLQERNYELYELVGNKKAFGILPYIWLWRRTGLNIFSIIRI